MFNCHLVLSLSHYFVLCFFLPKIQPYNIAFLKHRVPKTAEGHFSFVQFASGNFGDIFAELGRFGQSSSKRRSKRLFTGSGKEITDGYTSHQHSDELSVR